MRTHDRNQDALAAANRAAFAQSRLATLDLVPESDRLGFLVLSILTTVFALGLAIAVLAGR